MAHDKAKKNDREEYIVDFHKTGIAIKRMMGIVYYPEDEKAVCAVGSCNPEFGLLFRTGFIHICPKICFLCGTNC